MLYYISIIAMLAVAIVLFFGLKNMAQRGSSSKSQKLMRLRIAFQFVAVVVVMTALYFSTQTGETMVVLNKIYTKTAMMAAGLGNGERRKKFDVRVSAYGAVDETNACIGLARLHTKHMPDLDAAA